MLNPEKLKYLLTNTSKVVDLNINLNTLFLDEKPTEYEYLEKVSVYTDKQIEILILHLLYKFKYDNISTQSSQNKYDMVDEDDKSIFRLRIRYANLPYIYRNNKNNKHSIHECIQFNPLPPPPPQVVSGGSIYKNKYLKYKQKYLLLQKYINYLYNL